jgi:AraC-like DNA-binding protein
MALKEDVPRFDLSNAASTTTDDVSQFGLALADIFAVTPLDPTTGEIEIVANAWHFGTLMIGQFAAGPLAFHRSNELVATSGLDHLLVQLYVRGGFSGSADGQPITVEPGDLCVFDLSRTLETRATAFANISLLIPRVTFEAQMDTPGALHGITIKAHDPIAGLLSSYLVSLVERAPQLDAAQAPATGQATAALIVTLLATFARTEAATRGEVHSPLRDAVRFIDANIMNPQLDADLVAGGLNMSRARLYRLLEPFGGIARYIRQRRLVGAAMALSNPAMRTTRIGEVAFRWGFGSIPTFNRAFQAEFGLSPSEVRARGIASVLAATDGADEGEIARFTAWMRTLQG